LTLSAIVVLAILAVAILVEVGQRLDLLALRAALESLFKERFSLFPFSFGKAGHDSTPSNGPWLWYTPNVLGNDLIGDLPSRNITGERYAI
jgi:hypothetical protein